MMNTEDNNLLVEIIKARAAILSKAKGANPDPAFTAEINKCLTLYCTKAGELLENEDQFEAVEVLFQEIANLLEDNRGSFENEQLFELFQHIHSFVDNIRVKK